MSQPSLTSASSDFPTWTLTVKDFPPIREAHITPTPMMLFMGDNNSGKTRLMSLLWGILECVDTILLPQKLQDSPAYRACEQWLKSQLPQGLDTNERELPLIVEGEGALRLTAWFNERLKTKAEELTRYIFNAECKPGELSISVPEWKSPPAFRLSGDDLDISYQFQNELITPMRPSRTGFDSPDLQDKFRYDFLRFLCMKWIFGNLYTILNSVPGYSNPLYFPASRAGFMIAFRTLVSTRMRGVYDDAMMGDKVGTSNGRLQTFPLPIERFLSYLTTVTPGRGNGLTTIAEFLEARLLKGKIVRDGAPMPSFEYQPTASAQTFGMSHSASLIAELAPLALLLRSDLNFRGLVLDEPEANLHLEAQRQLARVLVRLVNARRPVWCTTHGDTFVQQLNIHMRLASSPVADSIREEFGYLPDESLEMDQISAYQFDTDEEGWTSVRLLKHGDAGIPAETLGRAIRAQTRELQRFDILEEEWEARHEAE